MGNANILQDRGDDEMEFEIDQIPDEALHELLKLVRKSVPSTTKSEDIDYRPVPDSSKHNPSANQAKGRKNKPMKGSEQDLQINRIKAQLNAFQDRGLGDGKTCITYNDGATNTSPGTKDDVKEEQESSEDDSDSGSESEEE